MSWILTCPPSASPKCVSVHPKSVGIISMKERKRERQDVTTSCTLDMRVEIDDDFGKEHVASAPYSLIRIQSTGSGKVWRGKFRQGRLAVHRLLKISG